jgi:D-alanyl-D-alanine carboxypeptidase
MIASAIAVTVIAGSCSGGGSTESDTSTDVTPPAAAPGATGPPPPTPLAASLDASLASGLRDAGAPGAQGALFACGRLVWSDTVGVAVPPRGPAVTPETRYVVQSVTKLFTATMLMALVQQGKVALDTPLARFYPELPNAGRITMQMLIDHRSGLPEYVNEATIQAAFDDPAHQWSRDEVLASLSAPAFPPGSEYRYTNSNYVVLGGIIEKVTGGSIEDAFEQLVAKPAGLQQSSFTMPPTNSPLFAHPYAFGDDGKVTDRWTPGQGIPSGTIGPVWTDGGLVSTATDLARFGDALFAGRVVPPATVAQMKVIDADGEGLGPQSFDFGGTTWLGHSGSYGGFEAELWTDPARQLTLAVTTNMDEAGSDGTTSSAIWSAVATTAEHAQPAVPGCT